MKFKIVEIFSSLEGEGSFIGSASVFVRLFGCNLRCSWCDTKNSYEPFGEFKELDLIAIKKQVENYEADLITITGGEPFLCENLYELTSAFVGSKKLVKIETNGTLWQEKMDSFGKQIFISCSPKPPKYLINSQLAKVVDELKFVVDYALTIDDILKNKALLANGAKLVLQLLDNEEFSLIKALGMQKELAKLGVRSRVLPQIHKLLAID